MIPYQYALENSLTIVKENSEEVFLLLKDKSLEEKVKNDLINIEKRKINFVYGEKYKFEKYFEEYFSIVKLNLKLKEEIDKLETIENYFKFILEKALEYKATDIHVFEDEEFLLVKFRIKKSLRTFLKIPIDKGKALVRIIKLESGIKISKLYSPKEGRFDFENKNFRVSIIPTINGDKIEIRILGNINNIYTFKDIGFSLEEELLIKEKIKKSKGFILVTGPTGSGKSTTIFTIINYLNNGKKHIVELADPVEYKIDGISQISMNKIKDISFNEMLKFILRQDIDVINIGEIRDSETAKLSINAASTGHLVFSTIHTNGSLETIDRLSNLGIESFKLLESLSLIISERLVRILCPYCKKSYKIEDKEILEKYKLKDKQYFKKTGCSKCLGTGYIREKAVFEILDIDNKIKKMIVNGNLKKENINIKFMNEKLIELFKNGETDFEEINKYME